MKKLLSILLLLIVFSCSKDDNNTTIIETEDNLETTTTTEETTENEENPLDTISEEQINLESCFTLNKELYLVGEELIITNCSTDANNYNFNFGNGNSSTEETPSSVSFDETGTFEITLTVSDNSGNTRTTSQVISIEQENIVIVNTEDLLSLGYNYGTLPTNINNDDVTAAYTSWKNTFTESCGDNRIRVKFDEPNEGETVSEGIGYGMLIAAYANDQALLDGLWNYYNAFLNTNGVMNWKINGCSSIIGFNGASDAELDVAMALIIASKRWGNNGIINYEEDAISLIETIKEHEIESGTYVLKPGDVWGGSSTTNISYFAPAYYSAYRDITQDNVWNNVTNKSYDIIDANLSKTGAVYNLVSDWCKADGDFSTEVASWAKHQGQKYDYDASRTPWRITLDYLWNGNDEALDYANKCIDFINAKNGLNNIYPGYNLDGTPYETSYKDITFTGAYAIAAMASTDQTFVNSAYTKVVEMTTDAYFGATLRVLYLLTISGNFYAPNQF